MQDAGAGALWAMFCWETLGSVDVTVMFTTYINTAADRALHSCLFQRDGAPCQGVRPLWGAPPSQPEWALVVFSERTCPVNGGRRKICCRHLSIWIQDAVKDVCSPGLDGRKQLLKSWLNTACFRSSVFRLVFSWLHYSTSLKLLPMSPDTSETLGSPPECETLFWPESGCTARMRNDPATGRCLLRGWNCSSSQKFPR